jgi:serine/threonine-protein kinase
MRRALHVRARPAADEPLDGDGAQGLVRRRGVADTGRRVTAEHTESRWEALYALADTLGDETVCGLTFRPFGWSAATTDTTASTTPTNLPLPADDLVIGDEIGRGGMGSVHRATQTSLARAVAIKRLHREWARLRGPFLSEAQVLGRLEHPNIIPVHVLRAGADGEPLCAMKLVEGASWDELLHDAGDDRGLVEHLSILCGVCNAVAFAHSRGILHRDIKPANVMVGDFGQVYLTDWGLAVALDRTICDGTAIIHRDDVISPAGTPGYMAPELALGDAAAQDERTDVYLLGGCLHEVLVRRRRHEGTNIREVLEAALRSDRYTYPPDAPQELAAICNRATAGEPAYRFQSVDAFREAVEAYLDHRQAQALIDEAALLLARMGSLLEQPGSDEHATAIHRAYAETRFALQHALKLWPDAPGARALLFDAATKMIDHAEATNNLGIAERVLAEHGDEAGIAERVASQRAATAQRDAQIANLRDAARKRDWSVIAAPMGTAFYVAGLLGGTAALATLTLPAMGPDEHLVTGVSWALVALLSGAGAFALLRGRAVPENLVSPRIIGLWGAVAAACALFAIMSQRRGQAPFDDASDECAFMAIGFAAMAMQTRRWLLLPAAAFFVGSIVMQHRFLYNVELFGGLWLLAMVGVGIALRSGARLDDR